MRLCRSVGGDQAKHRQRQHSAELPAHVLAAVAGLRRPAFRLVPRSRVHLAGVLHRQSRLPLHLGRPRDGRAAAV